jgi:carotenoid cleavage dioxygenase
MLEPATEPTTTAPPRMPAAPPPHRPATDWAAARAEEHLRGVFAPVDDELDVADLPVRGTLPPDLRGTYLRNGPNPQFPPIGEYTYPFDGDGMLHAVRFADGKARYRNRFIVTRDLAVERRAGRALYGGLLSPVTPDFPDADPDPVKNVSNTSFVAHAGKVLSLWEGGPPYELTDDLGTLGEYTFQGALPGAFTAHPKLDPVWDEMCWFRVAPEPPYLVYGVVDPRGRISRTTPIDIPRPVYMHDFAITSQHVVFFDSPAVLDPAAGARGGPPLAWDESAGTRIGVLEREGDHAVRWFPVENRFAMHVMNAHTAGHRVVVDYVHRRAFAVDQHGLPDQAPKLYRTTIDLSIGTVTDELLDGAIVELPRIDDRRTGLEYRYGYTAAQLRGGRGPFGGAFDTLQQYDFRTSAVVQHSLPEGVVVGEPQFVARPGGTDETDGWVLAFTYDTTRDASELVVLRAEDFAAPPVASIPLPRRVPAGLHGTWLPAH